METSYTYTASTEFINNLIFEYVETYSFQRGADFEENLTSIRSEYNRLKVRKEKQNNLTKLEEKRFLEMDGLLGSTQYLLNGKGEFHPSSKKINTFQFDDPAVLKLTKILRTEIGEVPRWLCSPIYRDAVVFYDKESNIVSTLNVCLSCQYMETRMFNHINGDYETYDLLKRFFWQLDMM